jgi:hypothetical protein
MEGAHCFNPSVGCDNGTFVHPVIEYRHDGGACSVTGGYRYRGTANARLRGDYIYGDLCTGLISSARLQTDNTWLSTPLINTSFIISTFGEDVNGEIYVADHSGAVHQIVDTAPTHPKRRAVRP